MHRGHKRFIPGVPIWSQFRLGGPSIYCSDCKIYHKDKLFYFTKLIKFESARLFDKFLRLVGIIQVVKLGPGYGRWKYIWQK